MSVGLQSQPIPQAFSTLRRLGFALAALFVIAWPSHSFAQTFTLSGPGITTDASCSGFSACYTLNLGTVDALGVNTSATFTEIASTAPNGELYVSNATANAQGAYNLGWNATITATATTPFVHSALLSGEGCSSGCGSASGFRALTTSATTLYSGADGAAIPLSLGALVAEVNGASAYSGVDTEVVTLTANFTWWILQTSSQIRLTIKAQPQTAISASLTTVNTGSTTDYSYNFGNVNGLGVGSTLANQKCTAALCPSATLPATVYYSPQYTYSARFANFASSTATLKASVSTNFSTSAQGALRLCDAATTLGTCSAFPVTLSSTLGSLGSVPRYLGLIVAEKNGTGNFTGNANATITFTLTVP